MPMPTSVTLSLYCGYISFSDRNSARQTGHHVVNEISKKGLPCSRRDDRVISSSDGVVRVKSGARSPTPVPTALSATGLVVSRGATGSVDGVGEGREGEGVTGVATSVAVAVPTTVDTATAVVAAGATSVAREVGVLEGLGVLSPPQATAVTERAIARAPMPARTPARPG